MVAFDVAIGSTLSEQRAVDISDALFVKKR